MSRRSDRLSTAALILAFAAMTAWTWERWTEVQVDYGREVYAAWRVALGAHLYRDVAWLHGPLSVEWNALLLRVFGVGLRTLHLANLVLIALTAFVLRGLFARWFGLLAGSVCAVVFVAVFALGHHGGPASYNFVAPYSHELPHGAMLALAGFALLQRAEAHGRPRTALAAGVLFGAVLLTKAEVALAVLVALGAFAALRRGGLRPLALGLVVPLAGAALLGLASGGASWEACVAPWRSATASGLGELPFYRAMAGLDLPGRRLAELALRALGWGTVAAAALALERAVRGRGEGLARRVAAGAASLALAAAWIAPVDWLQVLQPLPLALALLLAAARAPLSRPGAPASPATLVAFTVFALVLLAKMILATWALQYGFVLALPGTLLVIAVATGDIPRRLRARGGSGAVFRALALAAVAAFTLAHLSATARSLGTQTVRVGSGRDAFWSDARGRFANAVLAELDARPPGTLVVLPEGALLNYLSRSVNPTPFVQFLPPEFLIFGEATMTAALAERPPDRLVLWHKDTSEYGLPFLGRDYGRAIGAWANGNYRTVFRQGDAPLLPGSRYGIALLERRAAEAAR